MAPVYVLTHTGAGPGNYVVLTKPDSKPISTVFRDKAYYCLDIQVAMGSPSATEIAELGGDDAYRELLHKVMYCWCYFIRFTVSLFW